MIFGLVSTARYRKALLQESKYIVEANVGKLWSDLAKPGLLLNVKVLAKLLNL
jgi:hypothetical protein